MLTQLVQGLRTAAAEVGVFLPRFVGFLIVLLIGYAIAKGIEVGVRGLMHRFGFNGLVERGGVHHALAKTKYDASGLLGRIVFYAVMLFVLQLAFGLFGPNPVSVVLTAVIAYLPRLFAAGLIVVIGAATATFVREVVEATIGSLSYGRAVAGISGGAVLFVTAFAALDELAIAPAIVTGLFYASLATIVGTVVVAAGGGGIYVMRDWWERASNRIATEAPTMMREAQGAGDRTREREAERTPEAKEAMEGEREPVGAGKKGGDNERKR